MKLEEDKITAYLLGELDVEEEIAVREVIANDEELQKVVADYELLLKGFRQERVNRYAAEVAETTPTSTDPPKGGQYGLWFLSGLILLFGAFWLFWPEQANPEQLAQQYFILPNDPAVAGQTEVDLAYRNGLNAFFRDQNYQEATSIFIPIQSDSLHGIRSQFYLGHAYFKTKEYTNAHSLLEASLGKESFFSRVERQNLGWNILMTRLAQGEDVRIDLKEFTEMEGKAELLRELEALY